MMNAQLTLRDRCRKRPKPVDSSRAWATLPNMRSPMTRVIGVDPGIATTGVAVIEKSPGRPIARAVGVIRTPAGMAQSERLALLRARFAELLEREHPDAASVERLFFNSNVKTAMAVGQASGVLLATAAEMGIPVTTYTPLEVKQSVVGVGSADKKQVGVMVAALLGLKEPPRPADASDACALAICHLNRSGLRDAVEAAR